MPRLLSSPSISAAGQRLQTPAAPLHADVRALIEQAHAEGYAAGHAAGRQEAHAGQRAAAAAAGAELRAAIDQEIARLGDARSVHDGAVLELATQIATYVVDAVDTSAVIEVTRRIRAALEQIDDSKVVAHVHPQQVDAVAAALTGADVRVVAAQDVAGGDVRLVGRWSVADLSIEQRWSAVQELLDATA